MIQNHTIIPNPLGFEVVTRKSKKLLNLILKKYRFIEICVDMYYATSVPGWGGTITYGSDVDVRTRPQK